MRNNVIIKAIEGFLPNLAAAGILPGVAHAATMVGVAAGTTPAVVLAAGATGICVATYLGITWLTARRDDKNAAVQEQNIIQLREALNNLAHLSNDNKVEIQKQIERLGFTFQGDITEAKKRLDQLEALAHLGGKDELTQAYLAQHPALVDSLAQAIYSNLDVLLQTELAPIVAGIKDVHDINREIRDAQHELKGYAEEHRELLNEVNGKIDVLLAQAQSAPVDPPPPATRNNLPFYSIGAHFMGREEALQDLRNWLTDKQQHATAITQAVQGLGGIGKTRLAIEFAWECLNDGRGRDCWFVSGEAASLDTDPESTLRAAFAALAEPDAMNLPEFEVSQDAALAAVYKALGETEGWLMIVDNVDDERVAAALQGILPKLNRGHVLVTSRLSRFPDGFGKIPLGLMPEADALKYLLERTDGDRAAQPDDEAQATALAKTLGHLPLAIELAAAFIREEGCSFHDYIENIETNREKILAYYPEGQTQYRESILAAWAATEAKLSPGATALLRIAAFLAPQEIPKELFTGNPALFAGAVFPGKLQRILMVLKRMLGEGDDVSLAQSSINELVKWSMITREGDTFSIHRLVQDAVRGRMDVAAQCAAKQQALNLFNAFLPSDPPAYDVRSWPRWNATESHVEALCDHCEVGAGLSSLLNDFGAYLYARARHREAEPLYRRALEIHEKRHGPEDPNVAVILGNLATLLRATNRPEETESFMRRALKIHEKSYGTENPNVAICLNNLAGLLQDSNRLEEAEPLLRRALEIHEKSYGPEDSNVAMCLGNLAILLQNSNRLEEAELLMRRALKINEQCYGPEHPSVAKDLNNLATLLQDTNRLEEAEPLMRRALKIDEQCYGPEHPEIAKFLNNLAQLLRDTNRLEEAETISRRMLEIFQSFTITTGHENPHFRVALNNYAGLLQDMGMPEDNIKQRLNEILETYGMSLG